MKTSTRLADMTHILCLIALFPEADRSSQALARSICLNPATVRAYLSILRQGGFIQTVAGHPNPKLARSPEDISLLALYRAAEPSRDLLHINTHTNPECGDGIYIQEALQGFYDEVQKSAERKMESITLRDILNQWQTLKEEHGWLSARSRQE